MMNRNQMRILLFTVSGLLFCNFLQAQQIPQVSYFMYDHLRTNPGSAGSMDMVCISPIVRNQMQGMPGAPRNFIFNAEAPFNLLGTKHGVGLTVMQDKIGLQSDVNMNLTYAYRFTVGDGTLGIGIAAGFIDSNLEVDGFISSNNETKPQDKYIPEIEPPGMTLTMGAGVFYRTEEIYFGVSSLHLNEPVVKASPSTQELEVNYNLNRHYYVTSGYNMQLSNPAWELKPAVLLKSDIRTTDMDVNLTALYNKRIWGGVSYRYAGAVVLMAGLELFEGLKIGYAYDIQTTSLITRTQGSHEIVLNYCFKIGVEKAPQKYKSIRFL